MTDTAAVRKIGFVGIGNMGGFMAANLVKAGHKVTVADTNPAILQRFLADNPTAEAAISMKALAADNDAVITMLPQIKVVKAVLFGDGGDCLADGFAEGKFLIDMSSSDPKETRELQPELAKRGIRFVDAPVSGGVGGAVAGTLTLMVGGSDAAFAQAKPVLEAMGKNIVHCGGAGAGQAAKVCNNMMLGISMIAVSEAFTMAEKLGLDTARLFEIASKSSGQSWAMTSYCPVPGLVETAASNRGFKPGFTASMMLKDLRLAQDAAETCHATTPLGREAARLFAEYVESGHGAVDFSGIIQMLRGH